MLAVDDVGEAFYITADIEEPIDPERVCEMMHRSLEGLIEALGNSPRRASSEVDVLGGEERRRILEEWNETRREVPERTVPELFEEQVEKTPEAVAVVYEGRSVSYRELNERANGLAHYLIGRGVGPESIVGICVPRSVEMVVGLLGILKAGGGYLPLDPSYPAERLKFMVEDAGPECVVTVREYAGSLPEGVEAVSVDEPGTVGELSAAPRSNPTDAERRARLEPDSPAYVI